jgi:tight adherence protein C
MEASMIVPLFGAGAIAAAVVLVFSTLTRAKETADVSHNLTTGLPRANDLRDAMMRSSPSERALGPAIDGIGRRARRLTPAGWTERLEHRIVVAGSPAGWSADTVILAKVVGPVIALILGFLWLMQSPSMLTLAGVLLLVLVLFLAPDAMLSHRIELRQDEVIRALPDLLDQLTITVEAGLAFEASLTRSVRTGSGPLHDELVRTLQDVQVGLPRREALRGLADRVGVRELRTFVAAVNQADEYGLPVAQVLRIQAGEMRLRRSQRAEEQAMKLPVKLLFPTIFFIFPVMFIVLLGPAALQIARGF